MAISDELRKLVDPNNDCCCEHCLSNRCKEWALTNKYKIVIYSDDSSEWYCQVQLVDVDKQPKEWSVAQTEPGATFKACQWILDNKEIK